MMPLHPSRQEELRQLLGFRDAVNSHRTLGFKLKIAQPRGVIDFSSLILTYSGLTTLVVSGNSWRKTTDPIDALFVIPPGHAAQTRVAISFPNLVPFHPHVWTSGAICWGNVAQAEAASWTLTLWAIAVLEYLQMNQKSFIGINPNSPANSAANAWYASNRGRISREIPQINMQTVRQLSSSVG